MCVCVHVCTRVRRCVGVCVRCATFGWSPSTWRDEVGGRGAATVFEGSSANHAACIAPGMHAGVRGNLLHAPPSSLPFKSMPLTGSPSLPSTESPATLQEEQARPFQLVSPRPDLHTPPLLFYLLSAAFLSVMVYPIMSIVAAVRSLATHHPPTPLPVSSLYQPTPHLVTFHHSRS